eukprot:gene22995-biopygen4277
MLKADNPEEEWRGLNAWETIMHGRCEAEKTGEAGSVQARNVSVVTHPGMCEAGTPLVWHDQECEAGIRQNLVRIRLTAGNHGEVGEATPGGRPPGVCILRESAFPESADSGRAPSRSLQTPGGRSRGWWGAGKAPSSLAPLARRVMDRAAPRNALRDAPRDAPRDAAELVGCG